MSGCPILRRSAWLLACVALLWHAAVARAATGGPDGFGHTWADDESGCPASFPSLSDAAQIHTGPTAEIGPVALPFALSYYDRPVGEAWISPTGFVAFSDQAPFGASQDARPMPDAAPPDHLVAPFWSSAATAAEVAVDATPTHLLVVWVWQSPLGPEEVRLLVMPDGRMRMGWETTSFLSRDATVGYEDGSAGRGLTLYHQGSAVEPGFPEPLTGRTVCIDPPELRDCSAPLALGCGDAVATDLPATGGAAVYPCSPEAWPGNERVVRLDVPDLGRVRVSVDRADLGLFHVEGPPGCSGASCLASGAMEIEFPMLFPGSYWLAVDSGTPGGGQAFTLATTCEALEEIPCGGRLAGDTSIGTATLDEHPCAPVPLEGPEVAYRVSHPADGSLTVGLLSGASGLGVVLYDDAGACRAAGPGGATLYAAPAGEYVAVVDGPAGVEGPFEIAAACGPLMDCGSPPLLECGGTLAGDTRTDGAARIARYNCSVEEYSGPETAVSFFNPKRQNVSFVLEAAADLDLLLLERCDEGYCRKAADASLDLGDLPAGEYLAVVDGRRGAAGPWSVTAICGRSLDPESLEVTLPPGATVSERKTAFVTPDIPVADVLFAIDLTNSMGEELANLRSNAKEIIQRLSAVISDLRFGLASFEDYPSTYGGPDNCNYGARYGAFSDEPYRLDLPFTTDVATFQQAVDALALGSGEDGPESYSRVLWETVHDPALAWRAGARRLLVLFGDAIPHDCDVDACLGGGLFPDPNFGTDPGPDEQAGTADDLAVLEVLDEMAAAGNDIVLLYFDSSGAPQIRDLWRCYAGRTGGLVESLNPDGSIPGGLDLAELIRQAIVEEGSRCDTLTLAPSAGFEDWLVSLTPALLTDVVLPARVGFDLVLGPPAGTLPGAHAFTMDLLCEGVVLASQQVTIHVGDCSLEAVVPPDTDACEGSPLLLDGSAGTADGCDGEVRYQWSRNGSVVRAWDPDPVATDTVRAGASTYLLEVRCFDDPSCTGSSSASFDTASRPDPVPGPIGKDLRVARAGAADILVTWTDLPGGPGLTGAYQAAALDADEHGAPLPGAFDGRPALGEALPGEEAFLHEGALGRPCFTGEADTPCRLVFYKVRATSPCSGSPGPTCDGTPAQAPCP